MGCIFSFFLLIFKIIKFVIKVVIAVIMFLVKVLIRCGLVVPAIYAIVGFGLWLSNNEIMLVGTIGFIAYHTIFILLTVFCIYRAIKSAVKRKNDVNKES